MTVKEIESRLPQFLVNSEICSVVVTDIKGRYVFASKLFEQRFSVISTDIIGRPFSNNLHIDDVEKYSDAFYQCTTDPDKNFNVQIRHLDADLNNFYWIQWEFSLFKDQNANPIGVLCLGYDITERKQAEDLLHVQSLVLDQIMDFVTFTDLDGVISYVNNAELEASGRPMHEIVGSKIDIFGEDVGEGASQEEILDQTLKKGAWRGEIVNYSVDGRQVILDCRTQIVKNEQGIPISICGISTDITERKERERWLEASKQQFKELADSVTDVFFALDENLNYTYWNRAVEELMGIKAEDAIGKRITEVLPNTPRLQETITTCKRVMLNKQSETYISDYFIGSRKHYFEISIYPSISGISVFAKDITDRKEAEIRLKHSEYKLKAIHNSTSESNIFIGSDYKIQSLNQVAIKYCEMVFGRKIRENDSILDFTLPETKDIFLKDSQKALNGEIVKREIPINGFWFEITLYPVHDERNNLIGFSMNSTNIDERKKAEEYRKALLASIPDLFFVLDVDGVFLDYKAEKRDLLLQEDAFLNKSIYEVLPPELANQLSQAMQDTLGRHITTELNYSLEMDGGTRFYQARINSLGEDKVIVLARDITEVQKHQNLILKQNEILRDIAWHQSHKLRAPVARMLLLIDLLKNYENEREEAKLEYIGFLIQSIEELDNIIHKIVHQINQIDQYQ
jgi:PAS domain S-box-containing protein